MFLATMFVVLAAASASHAQGNGTFSAICNTGKWNCTGLGNVSNQPQGRTLEVSFFTANMSAARHRQSEPVGIQSNAEVPTHL
jgi:hypothetical protein